MAIIVSKLEKFYGLPALCLGLFVFVLGACSEQQQAAMPPPLVQVQTVEARDVLYTGEYMAQTQGFKAVDLLARVEGVIQSRLYEEGQFVEEGQVMFEIEPDSYQGSFQQAEGTLAQARALYANATENLRRVLPLYERDAVSKKQRDDAQAAYDNAKAQVEAAQGALKVARVSYGYTTVVSPVSGFASKESLTPGNIVYNGSKLTTINMVDPMYVNFSIAAPEILQLNQLIEQGRAVDPSGGRWQATLTLVNGQEYPQKGEVTFLDRQVDPLVGVIRARATFANPDHKILPGQFCRLRINLATLKDALMIPQKSVIMTQQGSIVYVLDANNTAQARTVQLGITQGQDYLVYDGLKAGERIVVEGTNKVRANAPVSLGNATQAENQSSPPQPSSSN